MMDFVPYANGSDGSSSSLSSSNLSPLAPPFFAVDWSVQNPLSFKLAGYGVPPFNPSLNSSRRNWMSSRVSNPFPEFDTVPPNSYRYSAAHRTPPPHAPPMSPYVSASTDVFSYGTQRSNAMASDFTDAKPYYPSYVPTTFPGFYDALSPPNIPFFKGLSNNDSTPSFATLPHTGSWNGIWNGLPGLEQGQGLKLAGSSGSREVNPAATSVYKDHLDLGAYASNGLNNYGETSHGGHLSENPIERAIPGHQDFKSVPEKRTGLMAFDYLKTPISGSASVLPESCPLEPSLKQIDSRVNQVTYSGSYEKGMKHQGNNPNNSILSMKFAPGLVPPGSATCSSEPIEKISSVKNGNGGSDKVYMNFACDQHNWKESFSSPSFEEKYFFPSSQHCIQLEGTDRIFAKSPSTDNDLQERSICKDALDHFFGETSGFQDSNICTDELAWALDDDKTINRDENPSKHLDHYIPHLDSPCWKGAPVPHYRSLDVLELSTLQLTKKLEGSNSYNHQGPPFCPLNIDDAAKTSSLNPSEDSVAHKSKCLYNSLASPSNRPSTSSFSSREHGPNDAMKVGSNQAEPSSIFVTQSSDDVELSKCDTLPNKSFNEDNLQPSWIFQENSEEGKLPSEKKHTSGNSVTGGMNSIDASDCESSHRLFRAIEDIINSPASLEDPPSKLTGMHDKESPPKMNIPILVNAISNLSDLLLNYCSTGSTELKEQDSMALNNVINNLSNCLLKVNRQLSPKEEASLPSPATDQSASGSAKLHEMSKVAAACVPGKFHKQSSQEVKNHHGVSADAEEVKNDNMTQAIKKVLIENFPDEEETHPQVLLYKNLWLEAEAALCSITYMARFTRMKTEMEKGQLQMTEEKSTDAESPSRSKLPPGSNTFENLEAVVRCSRAADSSVQDSVAIGAGSQMTDLMTGFKVHESMSMNAIEEGKLIISKDSPEPDLVGKSEPRDRAGINLDFNDFLKLQINSPNSVDDVDTENDSWSKVSSDLDKVENLSTEKIKGSPTADIIQDFPVSSRTSQLDDVDALAMARFNILKLRDETSSSINAEQQQMQEGPGPSFACDITHWSIFKCLEEEKVKDREEGQTSERRTQPVSESEVANYLEDELTVKEFYLHVKDDAMVQPYRTNMLGSQVSSCPGIYDGSSSDWEHV